MSSPARRTRIEEEDAKRQSTPGVLPHYEPTAQSPSREFERTRSPLRRFLKLLGPGLITGASDDDPSGIATYSTAGAALGFATLWTAILTLPLMIAVQFICAKVGMVSGRGLGGVLRQYYPRAVLYPAILALLVANTINAGTDIAAIAAAINLLVPIGITWLIVPIGAGIVALQVWGNYRLIANVFKWLALSLFAYIAAALLAHPHWGAVLKSTFVPALQWNKDYLTTLVAILGTTISPYLFFWQASQMVEEEVSEGRSTVAQRKGATAEELQHAKWDTVIGMVFCNVVFYFVILACAATLHASGNTHIDSAAEAAEALRPLAGNGATYLFAIGLIGAGFLAVPVLTGSSAYAVAETFGWKYGLDRKPAKALRFYAVIAVSTLVGIGLDYAGVNPIRALFWTAVINGVLAPPLLVLLLFVSNNAKVMGKHVNGKLENALGWIAALLMAAAAVGMFAT